MSITKIKALLSLLTVTILLFSSCNYPSNHDSENEEIARKASRMYPSSVLPDRIMQSASVVPASQINLSWRTSDAIEEGFAEYHPLQTTIDESAMLSRENAVLSKFGFEGFMDHYFKVSLSGLEPDTEYMVRVGSSNHKSEWFSVRTTPSEFKPFHFLYFGDMQNDIREYGTRIFRHAAAHYGDAKFMLHAGDLVVSSGDDDSWGEWFHAGGWLLQQVPSIPVAGNSDHMRWQDEPVDQRRLFPQWHEVFHLPENGPKGLENLVYYVDHPGVRVIALYTNFESLEEDDREIYIDENLMLSEELFQQQVDWLEKTLATNQQPWLVVLMHHPVFTAREDRENLLLQTHFLPLFEKYKVDLVLQGHDHVYARGSNPSNVNEPNLPVYIVSIAGGKMREVDPTHAWIEKSMENKQLYQVIHVDARSLRFETIDLKGQIADTFTIVAKPDGSKERTEM